jgi:hypothetical protein
MGLFGRTDAVEKLKTKLASLADRRARLIAKRAAAQDELNAAEQSRLTLLTEGEDDPKAEAKAQTRVDAARSTLDGLDAALRVITTQIEEAERALATEDDRVARSESAARIDREVAAARASLNALGAMREASKAFAALGTVTFYAQSTSARLAEEADVAEREAAQALSECEALSAALIKGTARIPNRRTGDENPKPRLAPQSELTRVFTTLAIRWINGDGSEHLAGRYRDVMLPPNLAARALEFGAAVPVDHKIAKEKRGTANYGLPERAACIDLNVDDGTALPQSEESHTRSPEPSPHPAIQAIDRGPPYKATISAPRANRSEEEMGE